MNEEYLQGLHGHLGVKADYNTWVNNIKGNEDYLRGLHNHIGVKADYSVWKNNIFGSIEEEKKKPEFEIPKTDGKINFSELDKRNDMAIWPGRYDEDSNLKPEFEVYTDSKGIGHSRHKPREGTDTSVDTDFVFRADRVKDKTSQFLEMYNSVNKSHQEVQDLLRSRFETGMYDVASFEEIPDEAVQDVVNHIQQEKYKDIKSDMNDAEINDMHILLEKKYNLSILPDGSISIPEVKIESEYTGDLIGVKRAKEVQKLLSDVNLTSKEVQQEIAKQYFSLDNMPTRKLAPYDAESDYREFANTEEEDLRAWFGDDKYEQYVEWNKTGVLPMWTSIDGIGIDMETVGNVIQDVKDRTIQTYNERLSAKERFDYMKHMPTAHERISSFMDYYKQRLKDERDFKAKYGRELVRTEKGNATDNRVYIPVSDYGADWAKHFSKAQNQSAGNYIKTHSDFLEKEDEDLKVEIEEYNKINNSIITRQKKLIEELEDLGTVNSSSPKHIIDRYNNIIGELRALKQNMVDRGLDDIYADISKRSERLKADISGLTEVAETNQDLSIIAYANGLNYSNIDRTLASLEKGLLNPMLVTGSDFIDAVTLDKWDIGSNARNAAIKDDEAFEETFSRNLSFSWQNLDIWATQALANNSSSLLAVGGFFINPWVGRSLFFGMGYGHKVTDIERSRQIANKQIEGIDIKLAEAKTNDERINLEKQKDDWRRKKDISFWQERSSGILAGGTELVWETLGSVNAIKNFQKWSRVVGRGPMKRAMGVGYGLTLTQLVEYGEELGTEITNNIWDNLVLREYKSIFDGIDKDFTANVLITGLALQGKNIGQTTWSLFSDQVRTRDQKRENRKRLERLSEIDRQLSNPIKLNSVEMENLEKEKMDLIEEAGIETVMNIDKLNDLTFEEKQAVFEKARQAQEVLRELDILGGTGDLTSNYAKENKKFLMDKYNELVGEKDQLLDKGGKEIREKAKNSNNPAAAAYNAGLNRFVTNLARYNTEKNGKEFTIIDDINNLKQNEDIFDDYSEILDAYQDGDYAFRTEDGNVYIFQENVDNQIYGTVSTNKVTGEKTYSDNNTLEALIAAVSPFHENLHNRNRTAGIVKDGKVVESAVEAIEGIEAEMQALLDAGRIEQEVFDLFQARKKRYTDENTGQVNMEEMINIVGDLHFIGAIPPSSFNNLYGLKSLLNNASNYFFNETAPMVRFKTGRDVFSYVQSFHKQSKAKKVKLDSRTTSDKKAISLSKSTYDQFSPEELVEIIKDPAYGAVQKAAAENSLAKQFDLLAIKALNYDPKTGDITRENVISAAREYLPGIINRFNPESAKFSTFVTSNIAPKQAVIYEEAKSLSFETVSLDAPQAQQIADETTDLDNALEDNQKPKVNVLKINKVSTKEKGIRKATKIKRGDTHKEVTDNNTGAVGEVIFEVPSEKIADPKKNLTYSDEILDVETGEAISKKELKKGKKGIPGPSESKSIQNVFADFDTSRDFIKILPETNVSEQDADINKIGENIQVSRNVYGRAIGLPNRVLEYFYDPVFKPDGKRLRSQGKTSQVGIWKLKNKFKNPSDKVVTQFQRDLGITERQEVNELPKGDKRSAIGQLLKGSAKTFSQQVSLSMAQRKLAAFPTLARRGAKKAKAQEIADVTAGQSKLAFSKATQRQDIDNNILNEGIVEQQFEMDDVTHIDKLLTREGQEGIFRHRTQDEMDGWFDGIENDIIPNVPESILPKSRLKSILKPSKRIFAGKRFGLEGKGKDMIDIKKGKHKGKKMSINDYYDFKRKELLAKDLKYGKEFEGEGAKYVYGQKYGDKFGKTESQIKKSFKDGTVDAQNKINLSMHMQLWERINQSIKDTDGKSLRAWGSWLSMVGQDTEHPHRMGAELVGYSKNPKGVKNKKGKVKLYEWEHAMPATRAYLYLLNAAVKKELDFETSYGLVSNNFKLIALDSFEDLKLKAAGRTTSMGQGWSIITDSWLDRYFKGDVGIDANNIIGFNNKTFKDIYGIPKLKPGLSKTKKLDKAIMFSRSTNPSQGITVLDFDDTLATTESLVKFTRPDGTTGTLNAEQYAKTYEDLLDQGFVFDFSDFNKVVKGKIAPLFQKALKLQGKFGPENMFVLTARPPQAAKAIFDFLKANGLNIPMKNITGLANSTAEAKALWMAEKVGEGYNDFYFADDALQNVQAVKNMLDQFDVKSKVQQAKIQFSKSTNEQFNDILEEVTGIESKKRFSAIKARKRGESKGKFRFFIPPSHEDFVGLLYNFIGKGKRGNAHRDFFEKALIRPLNRAYRELNAARQSIANDYKSLNKEFKDVKDKLTKKIPSGDFTYQDAIRVYLWNKHGYKVPGLSKTDQQGLVDLVSGDIKLQQYAEAINTISKQEKYVNPTESWEAGDLRTDLDDATGRVGREQFFTEFFENADIIFSQENFNKIEAAYGASVVSAIKDILYRTKTGRNRPSGQNKLVNQFLNYLNGSVAATMFFNIRSAVLQQMSMVNFINFADNNVFAAAKAFANQKQYWADWSVIFNSDFMKQRRGGIKTDVNGAELAASVKGATNPIQALIKKLLELGFLPTQIGDNIAIATGGATFYRNRINTYVKQGLSQKEAEQKAWTDFEALAEATQQSARPDMVSQQQASALGKVILAFQNVTSQFNRLGKKAFLDIKNRRITPGNTTQFQSDISNLSRISYYFAIQNLIFYSLQSALFMVAFDDDEEDEKWLTKKERMIHGSIDSVLRGTGVWGSAVATLKNMAIKWHEQRGKGFNKDESAVLMEMLNVSPPLGIKARKMVNAEKTLNYNKSVIEEMKTLDIDNPMWSAVTSYTEAITNIPLNRLYNKAQNVRESLNNQHSAFERALMFSGWSKWNLGIGQSEKIIQVKQDIKEKKKIKKQEQAKINKIKKLKEKYPGLDEKEIEIKVKSKEMFSLKKGEQQKLLKQLGLSNSEILKLKKEQDRADKIAEMYKDNSELIDKFMQNPSSIEIKQVKTKKTSSKTRTPRRRNTKIRIPKTR